MSELENLLKEIINQNLIQIILSNTREAERAAKIKVRPVKIKDVLLFQETLYRGTQVFHENFTAEQMAERIEKYMQELFKQGEIKTTVEDITVLVSKKGKMTIKRKKKQGVSAAQQKEAVLEHNRTKQYILLDGQPVDFLVGLGVQTPD